MMKVNTHLRKMSVIKKKKNENKKKLTRLKNPKIERIL